MNRDTPLWCYVKKSFPTRELDMSVLFFLNQEVLKVIIPAR